MELVLAKTNQQCPHYQGQFRHELSVWITSHPVIFVQLVVFITLVAQLLVFASVPLQDLAMHSHHCQTSK